MLQNAEVTAITVIKAIWLRQRLTLRLRHKIVKLWQTLQAESGNWNLT